MWHIFGTFEGVYTPNVYKGVSCHLVYRHRLPSSDGDEWLHTGTASSLVSQRLDTSRWVSCLSKIEVMIFNLISLVVNFCFLTWLCHSVDWNNPYKHLGCYVDTSTNSTMDSYTSWTLLTDAYSTRTDPIKKCYYGTKLENYKVCSKCTSLPSSAIARSAKCVTTLANTVECMNQYPRFEACSS